MKLVLFALVCGLLVFVSGCVTLDESQANTPTMFIQGGQVMMLGE